MKKTEERVHLSDKISNWIDERRKKILVGTFFTYIIFVIIYAVVMVSTCGDIYEFVRSLKNAMQCNKMVARLLLMPIFPILIIEIITQIIFLIICVIDFGIECSQSYKQSKK